MDKITQIDRTIKCFTSIHHSTASTQERAKELVENYGVRIPKYPVGTHLYLVDSNNTISEIIIAEVIIHDCYFHKSIKTVSCISYKITNLNCPIPNSSFYSEEKLEELPLFQTREEAEEYMQPTDVQIIFTGKCSSLMDLVILEKNLIFNSKYKEYFNLKEMKANTYSEERDNYEFEVTFYGTTNNFITLCGLEDPTIVENTTINTLDSKIERAEDQASARTKGSDRKGE